MRSGLGGYLTAPITTSSLLLILETLNNHKIDYTRFSAAVSSLEITRRQECFT